MGSVTRRDAEGRADQIRRAVLGFCEEHPELRAASEIGVSSGVADGTRVWVTMELIDTGIQLGMDHDVGSCVEEAARALVSRAMERLRGPLPERRRAGDASDDVVLRVAEEVIAELGGGLDVYAWDGMFFVFRHERVLGEPGCPFTLSAWARRTYLDLREQLRARLGEAQARLQRMVEASSCLAGEQP
jgi:hypothetical protein